MHPGGRRTQAGRGGAPNSKILNAAALQDHLIRSLRLPSEVPVRKNKPVLAGPARSGVSDRVRDDTPRRLELTLAQRRNLVERPPDPLTERQWEQARAAAVAREDFTGECSICRDAFKVEEQVLLSCSHVFHAQCIRAFERFAQRKCCPLCRAKEYERRRIEDGAKAFRRKCAVHIQARVRGHLTRKWYRRMLASMPPRDPAQRRGWFADKLVTLNRSVLGEIAGTRREIEELFAEISHRQGRDHRRDSSEGEEEEEEEDSPPQSPTGAASEMAAPAQAGDVNWDAVVSQALERNESECPICMGDLQRDGGKGNAWLSCSHVFHAECLRTFEVYAEVRSRCRSCPICRASYVRKCL